MRNHVVLILIFSLLLVHSVQASTISANTFLTRRSGNEIKMPLEKASYYRVDKNALLKCFSSNGHLQLTDFPGKSGEVLSLDLKPAHSAIDGKTECIVTTTQGDQHFVPPSAVCYRGIVSGEEHSVVFISVSDEMFICSIHREDVTTYVFGPEKNSEQSENYILLPEYALLGTAPFTPFNCINEGIIQPKQLPSVEELLSNRKTNLQNQPLDNGKLLQTDIAVEADSQFYGAIGGDPAKTIAYIGAIFSMSSMIYENEANLTHHLSWIKVWTTSDPYQVHGNAYALPDTVRRYWQKKYAAVQRDVAHVMTSIGYGGGGFGYYSLCDPANSYSVSSPQTGHTYPTFAFTYDTYIISHEVGHNFNLIHTHDCWWNPPLDTCYTKDDASLALSDACYSKPIIPHKNPGTIMSYCQNTNYSLSGNFAEYKVEMTFSHRPDSVMRVSAENAACIAPPTDPTVILLSPRGGESYLGGATIPLQWTYANIQNVSLEYSTNSGTSWNPIQNNIPVAPTTTQWVMPNISSTKMLVRIFDPSHTAVGDTSLMFFTLTKNAVRSELTEKIFTVIPNPAKEYLILKADALTGMIQCDVVDELGITRKQFSKMQYSSDGVKLDLHGMTAGKYFLRIKQVGMQDTVVSFVVE